ncbi:MAG: lipopolysaccharide heptosyltransferase II [Candidatus Omnitrophica bacterium]|nr:lipopolysaccharide heptosyltransferase II [Candidatus Omnitrophota bacterium]
MNILQILPELNVGGVETGTLDLARQLVKRGHKAVVVSAGGELVKELESCGAIHYQLPVHKKSLFVMFRMVSSLVEIIRKEKIDIVHARSRIPAWPAYWAARRTRTAFITTCHGYYKKHPFSYVMGWGKRVIVLSNAIARHMIDDFGVAHERIRLIPRSVDLEKFKFISPDEKRKEEFNVGIIGRITPIKGHLVFIKAMAKLARVAPRLKIWIIGDAPSSKEAYKEQIHVLVRRLGLWSFTQFLGTQRDIPGILGHLDLLVMATTTQEAFGRVIIEAQAAGVPVVATRVGGVVDIIDDEKNGLLVPASDPQSMADAAIRIFKDAQLARRLAENAYSKVKERYNIGLMVDNTLAVYRDALDSFSILIIKLSSLGDVILSTAAIKAIKQKFGANYRLSVLVGEGAKDVLLRCPYIDELLVCDLENKDKGLSGLWKLGAILRKKNFDLVVDLQNSRKSHTLSFLSFSSDRYGYDNGKLGLLLNHRVKNDMPLLDPLRHQFRILEMLGIDSVNARLELWPSEQDRLFIEDLLSGEWLSSNQKIVGINLSASSKWATKNWPLPQMTKFCEGLLKRDLRIVLTGTDADLAAAAQLMEKIKDLKPINACGKTSINQLASLIKRCSVYVSADSAPLHIAASTQTPFVALFGPTDPRRHLPLAKKFALIRKDLDCTPCYKPQCKKNDCMQSITAEEVLAAVDKLLET